MTSTSAGDHPVPVLEPVPDRLGPTRGAARRPATDAERRALASVLRVRILRLCLFDALTNRQLADRLQRDPATVLHHVRTLVGCGFLVALPARPGRRGAREVPYRATGKSWELDYSGADEQSDILLRTFQDEIAQIPAADVHANRLGLQLDPVHRAELETRLRELLDEFATRPHDPGGQRLSVFVAIHPQP